MRIDLSATTIAAVVVFCAATGVALAAASVDVVERDKLFEKTAITVAAGDTLNFVNKDAVSHNVMSRGDDTFNLGLMRPGETKSRTFSVKGKHEVTCALHPRMKMTIEVK
jgi:plastocyanin